MVVTSFPDGRQFHWRGRIALFEARKCACSFKTFKVVCNLSRCSRLLRVVSCCLLNSATWLTTDTLVDNISATR
jgi:hypothetical protein